MAQSYAPAKNWARFRQTALDSGFVLDKEEEAYGSGAEQLVYRAQGMRFSLLVRDYEAWWGRHAAQQQPAQAESARRGGKKKKGANFSGHPAHVASLANAFLILCSGGLRPGLGRGDDRFDGVPTVSMQFPTTRKLSIAGPVAFHVTAGTLWKLYGGKPRFYYRFTERRYDGSGFEDEEDMPPSAGGLNTGRAEVNHVFLVTAAVVDDGPVPLRKYTVGPTDNGVWWSTGSAQGGRRKIAFRRASERKDVRQTLELALYVPATIPLKFVKKLKFRDHSLSHAPDTAAFLLLAVTLHFQDWHLVPKHVQRLLLTAVTRKVRASFLDLSQFVMDCFHEPVPPEPTPLNPPLPSFSYEMHPVDVMLDYLAIAVASLLPRIDEVIAHLRAIESWIVPELEQRLFTIFAVLVAAMDETLAGRAKTKRAANSSAGGAAHRANSSAASAAAAGQAGPKTALAAAPKSAASPTSLSPTSQVSPRVQAAAQAAQATAIVNSKASAAAPNGVNAGARRSSKGKLTEYTV